MGQFPVRVGSGRNGYADRFASSYGVGLSYQYMGFALYSAFHQDPRYFLAQDRSTGGRVRSAVKQLFVARQDNGSQAFAAGQWGSAIGAGMLANTWQPHSTASVGSGLRRSGYILATQFALDLGKEFFPFTSRESVGAPLMDELP